MAGVSHAETVRRKAAARARRLMQEQARVAFFDLPMLDHAALIVWTRGQMNGVRAAIKRLGLA